MVTPASSSRRASGYLFRRKSAAGGSPPSTTPRAPPRPPPSRGTRGPPTPPPAPPRADPRPSVSCLVHSYPEPRCHPGLQDGPRLVAVEGPDLAEHVDPPCVAQAGIHLLHHEAHVVVRPAGELRRHRRAASSVASAVCSRATRSEFLVPHGLPVPGLHLHRGGPGGEVLPAPTAARSRTARHRTQPESPRSWCGSRPPRSSARPSAPRIPRRAPGEHEEQDSTNPGSTGLAAGIPPSPPRSPAAVPRAARPRRRCHPPPPPPRPGSGRSGPSPSMGSLVTSWPMPSMRSGHVPILSRFRQGSSAGAPTRPSWRARGRTSPTAPPLERASAER